MPIEISNFEKLMVGFCGFLCMVITSGCQVSSKNSEDNESSEHHPSSLTLFLAPMDGVTEAEAVQLGKEFTKNFASRQFEQCEVLTLPHLSSPDSCLNGAKTRYRADKLLKTLMNKHSKSCKEKADELYGGHSKYHIIGVTDRDISTSVHGHADYGILGLSYLRRPVSVVSTFRLKRKMDLWKLTAHEFCHGFYGCPHCKNDDPHCLIADAKGGNPHFEIKDTLCSDCAKICVIGE